MLFKQVQAPKASLVSPFGQAQHLTNFGRTKPPSGQRERELVACGAAENKALLPFEVLAFSLITWKSLNLKRGSYTSRGSQVYLTLISNLLPFHQVY